MLQIAPPQLIAFNNDLQVLGSVSHQVVLAFLPVVPHRMLHGTPGDGYSVSTGFGGIFLNFENIIGKGHPPVYDVYVSLAPAAGAAAESLMECYAGALPLYGLAISSTANWEHNAVGQQITLDITEWFNQFHAQQNWGSERLQIRLQPRKALAEDSMVSIGRVSLYAE